MSDSLVIFTKAEQMLAEAVTIQSAKELKDLALTAADWAKRKGMGNAAVNHARSYALEAERKMGQMLKETDRNQGGVLAGDTPPPKLEELGLSRNESAKAQKLADIPNEAFAEVKAGKKSRQKAVQELNVEEKRQAEPQELPDNQFPVIYADPPWRYEHSISTSRDIENQYPTMTLEEICLLPVQDIATVDSVLFLWATSPKLSEAMKVMHDWGFKYITCAVWDKEVIGMGYYFRQQHELLLVGKHGSPPTPLPENRPSSVLKHRREKHSKKPDLVYDLIDAMYPAAQKVELFGRTKKNRAMWTVWGNE